MPASACSRTPRAGLGGRDPGPGLLLPTEQSHTDIPEGPGSGPVGGKGLSLWGMAGEEVLAPPQWLSGAFLSVGGAER